MKNACTKNAVIMIDKATIMPPIVLFKKIALILMS